MHFRHAINPLEDFLNTLHELSPEPLPLLLVPLAVAAWAWRSGTDATPEGLTIRALFGRRRLPWARVAGFVPEGRRVNAVLDGGAVLRLPAVTPGDVPALLVAGDQKLAKVRKAAQ